MNKKSVTTEKRTLLVTGSSRGIGHAICKKLLDEGHNVIGIARNKNLSLQDHPSFLQVTLDLAEHQELPKRLRQLANRHPEISDIVLNAGIGRFGSLEEFSAERIRQLIDINLTAPLLIAREFLPRLKSRKRGNLIFLGSEAALSGGKKGVIYSATKFALRGAAQSLREECASSGIRVGIINPGMVKTDFFDELGFRPGEASDNHILPGDVAEAAWMMLNCRAGTCIDEINLSPQKKVIQFNP